MSQPARFGKWEPIRELGRGGQGVTYLARNTEMLDMSSLLKVFSRALRNASAAVEQPNHRQFIEDMMDVIEKYLGRDSEKYCGALKVLHGSARKDSKALSRLEKEVVALNDLNHPNIIRVIDSSVSEGWFVMPFCSRGTLANHLSQFKGQPQKTLEAFRDIVSGIAALHKAGLVHRDIKPENIFMSDSGLVLGDFGIVYFEDEAKTRVSESYENVGSRDWMPGWAMGMRVDDVRPSFDVYSLGKLLWAMVSGSTKMRLWYFKQSEFNLESRFPNDQRMRLINRLLDASVREFEDNVWASAAELLVQVDGVLQILRRGGQVIAKDVSRWCSVCGIGEYRLMADENRRNEITNFGLSPSGNQIFRIFECSNCGHVQLFSFTPKPKAWEEFPGL